MLEDLIQYKTSCIQFMHSDALCVINSCELYEQVGLVSAQQRTSNARGVCHRFAHANIYVHLKVPKCEIFHLFDFNDFYGIKSV